MTIDERIQALTMKLLSRDPDDFWRRMQALAVQQEAQASNIDKLSGTVDKLVERVERLGHTSGEA